MAVGERNCGTPSDSVLLKKAFCLKAHFEKTEREKESNLWRGPAQRWERCVVNKDACGLEMGGRKLFFHTFTDDRAVERSGTVSSPSLKDWK